MEFRFLSRIWGNERKEVEFSFLRSAIASTSHLKSQGLILSCKNIKNVKKNNNRS